MIEAGTVCQCSLIKANILCCFMVVHCDQGRFPCSLARSSLPAGVFAKVVLGPEMGVSETRAPDLGLLAVRILLFGVLYSRPLFLKLPNSQPFLKRV